MNKKISLGLTLALVCVAVAITASITMAVSMRSYNSIIKDLPSRSKLYSTVSELDDIIRNQYYGEINDTLLSADISSGYASGLGDRYSYHMTPAQYAIYKDELLGKKIGVGIIPFYHPTEMVIYVAAISENSPAAIAGLKKGDKILSVDEENITAYNYKEIMKKITGGENLSTVTLTYQRGQETPIHTSVVRGYNAQLMYSALENNVGYIQITGFYKTTASQLKDTIENLTKDGATSLIFDLRGCQKGTIADAMSALDVLVPVAGEGSAALATTKAKDGTVKQTFTAEADSVSMPMEVLVDTQTSGPAELFACDLRDYGMAQLIGEKTAGNGTVQQDFPLSDGGAIVLSTALIEPYISEPYNNIGLTPDFAVELSTDKKTILPILPFSDDDQYQKAYSLLIKSNEA